MTTDVSNRSDQSRIADRRQLPLFRETNRGVQAASRAYEDGVAAASSDERAKALRAVIRGGLL